MKTTDEEIKKDILNFYQELMLKQQTIGSANLASGGNLGKIIAAYILAKYGNKCNCNNRNSLY